MAECEGRLEATGDDVQKDCPVHLLPCTIAHNGTAHVSRFFRPKKTGASSHGLQVKEAAFRGRRLVGSTLQLPQGHQGFVVEKQGEGAQSEEPDVWKVKSQFEEITYWNHDTVPTPGDGLPRCFNWLNISAAIHRHVTPDEVSKASNT